MWLKIWVWRTGDVGVGVVTGVDVATCVGLGMVGDVDWGVGLGVATGVNVDTCVGLGMVRDVDSDLGVATGVDVNTCVV